MNLGRKVNGYMDRYRPTDTEIDKTLSSASSFISDPKWSKEFDEMTHFFPKWFLIVKSLLFLCDAIGFYPTVNSCTIYNPHFPYMNRGYNHLQGLKWELC